MTTYTVWSRGRELGHSTLAYTRCFPNVRVGDFHPTDIGNALISIITGDRAAYLAMLAAFKRGELEHQNKEELIKSTVFADIAAAHAHLDALQLELRGPDGRVIELEDLHVRDTELFVPEIHGERETRSDDDFTKEQRQEIEEGVKELMAHFDSLEEPAEWEPQPEFPRYQLHVVLKNEWDIP